jgi:hypothetical protein
MRRTSILILGFALTVITLTYNACGVTDFSTLKGTSTNTGNPMAPASTGVMYAVCDVINRCHPEVTPAECQEGLLATSGFDQPLGLAPSYSVLSSIIEAEKSGALTGNTIAGSACSNDITNLACSEPTVQSGYVATATNPFGLAPQIISSSTCKQVFVPGVNLEVPIELVDQGILSSTTTTTFARTRTSLDMSDYDGTVTYFLEIVGLNSDTVARDVSLIDSSGISVATISLPPSGNPSWDPIRYEAGFTPTSGSNNYRIQLAGTGSADQLALYEARIRVRQIGATRTKIFVPLTVGVSRAAFREDGPGAHLDNTTDATYLTPRPGWYSLWKKNNSAFSELAANNPWTLEAVLSGKASASLFNSTTGLQVFDSEVSVDSATPTLVSESFEDLASNFADQNEMIIKIKQNGSTGYLYRAGLWIKLANLARGEVYYRINTAERQLPGDGALNSSYHGVVIEASRFFTATFYQEVIGAVSAAGTSCQASVFDNGATDSGLTGSDVPGSTLTLSSTTPVRQRSAAFNLTSGSRFTQSLTANPGPGDCNSTSTFIVVSF